MLIHFLHSALTQVQLKLTKRESQDNQNFNYVIHQTMNVYLDCLKCLCFSVRNEGETVLQMIDFIRNLYLRMVQKVVNTSYKQFVVTCCNSSYNLLFEIHRGYFNQQVESIFLFFSF